MNVHRRRYGIGLMPQNWRAPDKPCGITPLPIHVITKSISLPITRRACWARRVRGSMNSMIIRDVINAMRRASRLVVTVWNMLNGKPSLSQHEVMIYRSSRDIVSVWRATQEVALMVIGWLWGWYIAVGSTACWKKRRARKATVTKMNVDWYPMGNNGVQPRTLNPVLMDRRWHMWWGRQEKRFTVTNGDGWKSNSLGTGKAVITNTVLVGYGWVKVGREPNLGPWWYRAWGMKLSWVS